MARTPFIHRVILVAFLTNTFGPVPAAGADEFRLPAPGVMVRLSPEFNPPVLKGIKVHPDNPFRFDFILDRGDAQGNLKQEAAKLIKYFLASLTIPEKDLWVNLSPYEKNRIIPVSFGLTEMGRDLLAEDYILKQITASLIYPEDDIGRKFWKRIYQEAEKKYGTTSIPVNTFNKVWIVPEKAVVYENAKAGAAYVVASRLKVMLDQDYLSMSQHARAPDMNRLGSQVIREIVIPELTKEVNEDKNFIRLRQVYNSLILAAWYKKKIKDSILSLVYSNKNKVAGVNIDDPQEKERIYQQYLKAFKKGVYNYIKEETDPLTRQDVPRKYFSGGVDFAMNGSTSMNGLEGLIKETGDPTAILGDKNDSEVEIVITPLARKPSADHAMLGGLFKPFVRIDAHSLLLPGGAVLLSDLDSSKVPNPVMGNKIIEEDSRGKVWITGSGGWNIDNTPFWVIDDTFGIMRRIEKLDHERKDKNMPIVILDWGCGKGTALIGLLQDLQRMERQGAGIANVVLYGFSDEFYPDWKKAPRGINFIWGTANHLKGHLERHLHGVNLIFSHEGLEHIFGNTDLFKRHLADLYDLLDPQSGVLLIADTPHHKGENIPYAQSVMHSKEISDGRFVIRFIGESSASHGFPSEWKPVVPDKAQLSSEIGSIQRSLTNMWPDFHDVKVEAQYYDNIHGGLLKDGEYIFLISFRNKQDQQLHVSVMLKGRAITALAILFRRNETAVFDGDYLMKSLLLAVNRFVIEKTGGDVESFGTFITYDGGPAFFTKFFKDYGADAGFVSDKGVEKVQVPLSPGFWKNLSEKEFSIPQRTALLEEQLKLMTKDEGKEGLFEQINITNDERSNSILANRLIYMLNDGKILKINLNGVKKGSYQFLREIFMEIAFSIADKTNWEENHSSLEFSIWELIKNAFVHGNQLDGALPIYIKIDNPEKKIEVFDLNLKSLGKEPDKKAIEISKYILQGGHQGVDQIKASQFRYTLTDMTAGPTIVGKMAAIELIGKPGDSDHAMSAHLIKFNDFVKGLFKDPGRIDLSSNSDALAFRLNKTAAYEDISFYLDLLLTEVINNALQEQKEGKIKVTVQGNKISVKNQGSIPWGKVLDKYYGLINKNDLYVSYKEDGTVEDLVREEAVGKEHKDIYKKAEKGLIDDLFKTSAGRITLLFARRRISFAEGKEAATNGGMGMSVAMGLLRARLGGSLKLTDDGQKSGEVVFEIKFSKKSPFTLVDQATHSSLSRNGGIDFTADRTPLEIQNSGQGIKFRLDPAQLQQLQDAPGFIPVIINIQPVNNLRQFLGLAN